MISETQPLCWTWLLVWLCPHYQSQLAGATQLQFAFIEAWHFFSVVIQS